MKRTCIGLILALAAVLAIGTASMAAPAITGEAGSLMIFGEYAPLALFLPENDLSVGVGYQISDNMTVGLQAQFNSPTLWGGFLNMSFEPFKVSGQFYNTPGGVYAKVMGLYTLSLDPIQVGLGGGLYMVGGTAMTFVEANANMPVRAKMAIHGAVNQNFLTGWTTFTGGLSWMF